MSGSRLLLCLVLCERLSAGPPLAATVNTCGSSNTCDFNCDCWDCSDENLCGYRQGSAILGAPLVCDFESSSSCGWQDVSTSSYQWVPLQANISTWGMEPPFDHSLGTDLGWYMTTTRQRGKPSVTARLRSPPLREAAATCEIRAWYHLWGPGLNETHLPVLTLELSHVNGTVTLWRNFPSSVYPWRELVAYTGRVQGTFQVTFSSTQAAADLVVLALDDVEFRNCGLPQSQNCLDDFPCPQGGCVAWDRFCDGTDDCGDGSDEVDCNSSSLCSFEDSLCDWTVVAQDSTWLRATSLEISPSHAWPTRDHSTNSQAGNFIYVYTHPLDRRGGKARLVSPALDVDKNSYCSLVLYLHLYDSATSSLNVYSRTLSNLTRLVWSRSGDLGDYWFREKVDFNVTEAFQIVIEGVAEPHSKGNIALDDLILSPDCKKIAGDLPVPLEPEASAPCSPEEFACHNAQCIRVDQVCNFHTDCDDGSDEQRCGATDFTGGTGGWMDISVGRLQWAVHSTTLGQTLDSVEHYFGLQEAAGQMLSWATATTPFLGPSGLACTVEMDFIAGPQESLALAVADEKLGTRRLLWSTLGNGTAVWSHATVALGERGRPFQLELLGLQSRKGTGEPALAVKNVAYVSCNHSASPAASSGLSCNFETDWCGWFPGQDDGFEWERSKSQGSGGDHTTGQGYFLAVDPSAPAASQGLSARLVSTVQPAAAGAQCLSFWYRLDGPQIGTLNLKVKQVGEAEELLWTGTGSHGAVWHRGFSSIPVRPDQNYQVIFEAVRNGFLGEMALDDIAVTLGACGAQTHCSFETDACGLSENQGLAWLRQNGAGGQGPSADHTLGTAKGHYMLINTSVNALSLGQKAFLWSKPFPPRLLTHCVMFWYDVRGSDPGHLSLSVKEDGAQRQTLSVSMTQGEAWHYGSVGIRVRGEWQVAFVAEGAGGSAASYIALDDFHVKEGGCAKPGSCDFESGTCGWSRPPGDWSSWDRKKGATPSQSPSPKQDHTTGTEAGHYVFVDVGVLGRGKHAARLVSELLPATTDSCLRFQFHMDFLEQSSQAELRVKLSSLQGEQLIWSTTGHQGRAWRNQTLFMTSPTEFQVVLEVTSGAWPSSGAIALDDLTYLAGPGCAITPEGPAQGSATRKESVAGLAAGIVCSILLILAATMSALYYLKRQRELGARIADDNASTQGFDIVFRDDTVIIPSLSSAVEKQ